jgi:hypothetical protein
VLGSIENFLMLCTVGEQRYPASVKEKCQAVHRSTPSKRVTSDVHDRVVFGAEGSSFKLNFTELYVIRRIYNAHDLVSVVSPPSYLSRCDTIYNGLLPELKAL